MADVFTIGRDYNINSGNNGNTLILGNIDQGDGGDMPMGAWSLHFDDGVNSGLAPFSGSLIIRCRSSAPAAQAPNVGNPPAVQMPIGLNAPWVAAPYRPGYLNGAVLGAGFIYVFTYASITTTSVILVPASGLNIAISVACASGSMRVYSMPTAGESAIG